MRIYPILLIAFIFRFTSGGEVPGNFNPANLVAWCIVPFDAKKRNPEQRAAMLRDLGMKRCAYDWRKEHVPEFEEEIQQYQKQGIEFFAFWGEHDAAFNLFRKYDLHPQVWKTLPSPKTGNREEKILEATRLMTPLAKRTAEIRCRLGLYNHGGWGGEPENLVAVCQQLRKGGHQHVGIVYNWHHGHDQIDRWKEALEMMKPYLHCLNLNGMNASENPKILPLNMGEHELAMIRVIVQSGYDGPIGILDHRKDIDAQKALSENLEGLKQILEKLP
jgi:hypothetical protein